MSIPYTAQFPNLFTQRTFSKWSLTRATEEVFYYVLAAVCMSKICNIHILKCICPLGKQGECFHCTRVQYLNQGLDQLSDEELLSGLQWIDVKTITNELSLASLTDKDQLTRLSQINWAHPDMAVVVRKNLEQYLTPTYLHQQNFKHLCLITSPNTVKSTSHSTDQRTVTLMI